MGRLVPVVAALAVVALAWLLPDVSRGRLAALDAHLVLAERVGAPPAEGAEDERPTLAETLLTGPAAHLDPATGRTTLSLYGSRLLVSTGGEVDLAWGALLRRSLVRGLRQHANDLGIALDIEGELTPADSGVNLELAVGASEVTLVSFIDGAPDEQLHVPMPFDAPGPGSVLPPLVAIALAILFRRPVLALFVGVLAGTFLLRRAADAGALAAAGGGFVDAFRTYFGNELVDPERAMIVGFVVAMLAMVGVMTRTGGIQGLMDRVAGLARTVRGTQVATWVMGLAVFFDDYANTILVGSTMRPLTDRFRIAREKLAYIVDSTAAPVAGLSIFSTWIAFEVSTFSAQLPAAGLATSDGYEVFLSSLPYRFYCLLTLAFVALVAFTGRDFGPMLTAERRARGGGGLVRPGGQPLVSERATTLETSPRVSPRAWRALLPLLVFVGVTLGEILRAGGGFGMSTGELFSIEGMTSVLYDGSGSRPLLVGSTAGFAVAALAALASGIGADVPRAAWTTLRSMLVAFAILYLAWMIGAVCGDLGTATYLTGLLGDALSPLVLPSVLFLLAGAVAFATGSSWSTMSILLPLVIGLAYGIGLDAGLAADSADSGRLLMVICVGAVLEGAIFGDHCSPISDTTVMSSIACASDHVDHVRTQAPYALLTMGVAMVAGYFPAVAFGLHPLLGLALGVALLAGVLFVFGKRADEVETA